jgi:hypothetical protein
MVWESVLSSCWIRLELHHRIGHVQFPVIEVTFDELAATGSSQILWPHADAVLTGAVRPSMTMNVYGTKPCNTPETWRHNNHPGKRQSTAFGRTWWRRREPILKFWRQNL